MAPLHLTNHENGVYDNVLIALANNALLPHNYLLVYFVLVYVVTGLATLLCWAFNIADRNQLLASEESLLGGMQITSDHHLDSVIELLLENYDIKCKQRNCLVDTLYMIYTYTVEPIVILLQVPFDL